MWASAKSPAQQPRQQQQKKSANTAGCKSICGARRRSLYLKFELSGGGSRVAAGGAVDQHTTPPTPHSAYSGHKKISAKRRSSSIKAGRGFCFQTCLADFRWCARGRRRRWAAAGLCVPLPSEGSRIPLARVVDVSLLSSCLNFVDLLLLRARQAAFCASTPPSAPPPLPPHATHTHTNAHHATHADTHTHPYTYSTHAE